MVVNLRAGYRPTRKKEGGNKKIYTKYNHSHTAFVENLNLLLATGLFKIMDAQELNQKGKTSDHVGKTCL